MNSIVCISTTALYIKHLLAKLNFCCIIVIYKFVQVNMMTTWYFYMKLTGRSRWIIDTCHLCCLQHWKLCHVWKTIEHDDNMIFLHEVDWKIKMNNRHMSLMLLATLKIVSSLKNYCSHHHDNRHIVKLLCLPQSLYKYVLTEFE